VGGVVVFYLLSHIPLRRLLASPDISWWVLLLFLVGVWCLVTGAVRFLLLTVGGGSARGQVAREIRQKTVVFRPVGRRAWWRVW
jgi:hypothetical protein